VTSVTDDPRSEDAWADQLLDQGRVELDDMLDEYAGPDRVEDLARLLDECSAELSPELAALLEPDPGSDVASVDPGDLLDPAAVAAARRRLLGDDYNPGPLDDC
jgi:hypothetical protein